MNHVLVGLIEDANPSTVIANNCIELIQREAVGIKKYGVSLTDAKLTHEQVLQHLLEEQLDGANYIRKALMTASAARLDYTLLRTAIEQLIEQTHPGRICNLHAPREITSEIHEEVKDMLFRFDTAKLGRDLKT